tara:strand:- start:533 stop:913 length:381 start_codon:yes stop_codon:yes gene_type:complete
MYLLLITILLLIVIIVYTCLTETFIINNIDKNCPLPWRKFRRYKIKDKCLINKGVLLFNAPKECCSTLNLRNPVSNCDNDDPDCGICKMNDKTYKLYGDENFPFSRLNTYCYPKTKNDWKTKRIIL